MNGILDMMRRAFAAKERALQQKPVHVVHLLSLRKDRHVFRIVDTAEDWTRRGCMAVVMQGDTKSILMDFSRHRVFRSRLMGFMSENGMNSPAGVECTGVREETPRGISFHWNFRKL